MSDSLGDRMKQYENISRDFLIPNVPVAVRVDGQAFHTYTKNFLRPFDRNIMEAMVHAAVQVASKMQNFVIGYVQSDEASFIMYDGARHETQPWFGNNKQKIVTIAASTFGGHFNRYIDFSPMAPSALTSPVATFDARAWNVPYAEVGNYLLWRAKDWSRNSVSMYAGAYFPHTELEGKTTAERHEMLYSLGKNWTRDLTAQQRNGTLLYASDTGIKVTYPEVELTYLDIQNTFDDAVTRL